MTTAPLEHREEQAKREIGHTRVGRPTAAGLVAVFLLVLLAVPLVDLAAGRMALPFADFARRVPPAVSTIAEGALVAGNRSLLAAMNRFEDGLEEGSAVAEAIQPPFQWVLTVAGRAGNEQVYVGRQGWLFFRPGFDLVTGPAFLDPHQLERRRRGGDAWVEAPEPDPLPAILELDRYLASRGIELLVVPAPTKASVHPDRWTERAAGRAPLHNASFDAFVQALREEGVEVLDPAPLLTEAADAEPQYLERDSHWAPAAVERVAEAVAERARSLVELPPAGQDHRRARATASSEGDLAALLRLPEGAPIWPRQRVVLAPASGREGKPWRPSPSAPVLLLGDSFTNVYSDPALGWGEGAGLAEQLSFHLGLPVARIARNAGGAWATRRELAARLALATSGRREDPLAGTRLVVYEFAARELLVGDWRRYDYAAPGRTATPGKPEPRQEEQVGRKAGAVPVRGEVRQVAPVPDPATTPYRDALVAILLETPEGDRLVYAWGMRDRELTRAARRSPGEQVELDLVPWSQVAAELDAVQRLELSDPELLLLEPWWTEELRETR